MNKKARLKSIFRGFGGDNAVYKGDGIEIMVCVGWALMSPHMTHVFIDGEEIAKFEDQEYIQPHVALSRLGYTVSGAVDFAASTCIDDSSSGGDERMEHYTMYCETCMEEIYSASDMSLLAKLATEHHFGHTVRIEPQKAMVEVTYIKLMKVAEEIIVRVIDKNKDYGDAWQQQGGVGWAVRLTDKLYRIENLASAAEALALDENIEDTLVDAIGYSLLGLLWLKENKGD